MKLSVTEGRATTYCTADRSGESPAPLGRDGTRGERGSWLRALMARGLAIGIALSAVAACSSAEPLDTEAEETALDERLFTDEADDLAPLGGRASSTSQPRTPTGVCASKFGDDLSGRFGRIDGIVYSVQKPSDRHCKKADDDHLIVQVLMNGEVYRMVTNIHGRGPDPDVRYATLRHALPAPAFSEGWHDDKLSLDYVRNLGVHDDDFTPYKMNDLVAQIAKELRVGAEVSVYASGWGGRHEGAHLIHRNKQKNTDGAIVVSPRGQSPKFLLFHFADQSF